MNNMNDMNMNNMNMNNMNMNNNMGTGMDMDMDTPYDFNDVPDEEFNLIPTGTKARLNIELIRPTPGKSRSAFLHKSKDSDLHFLRLRFTIVSDPLKGSRFMQNFMYGIPGMERTKLSTQFPEGTVKAINIAVSRLKAIIQSARGIDPKDKQANCAIRSFQELHNIQVAACIKISKNKKSEYSDFNEISYVIRSNSEDYGPIMSRNTTIMSTAVGTDSSPSYSNSDQPSPSPAPPNNSGGGYNNTGHNGDAPAWAQVQ